MEHILTAFWLPSDSLPSHTSLFGMYAWQCAKCPLDVSHDQIVITSSLLSPQALTYVRFGDLLFTPLAETTMRPLCGARASMRGGGAKSGCRRHGMVEYGRHTEGRGWDVAAALATAPTTAEKEGQERSEVQ